MRQQIEPSVSLLQAMTARQAFLLGPNTSRHLSQRTSVSTTAPLAPKNRQGVEPARQQKPSVPSVLSPVHLPDTFSSRVGLSDQGLTREAKGVVSHDDNGGSSTHAIGARSRDSLVMSVLGDPVGFPRFSPLTAVTSARIACEETFGNFQGRRTAPSAAASALAAAATMAAPATPEPTAPAMAVPAAVAALAMAVPAPAVAVPAPELTAPTKASPKLTVPSAVAVSPVAAPPVALSALQIFGLSSFAFTAPILPRFVAGTPVPTVHIPAIRTTEPAAPLRPGPGHGPDPKRKPRRLILTIRASPSSLARVTKSTTIPTKRGRDPSDDLYTATPRRRPLPPTAGMNEARHHSRQSTGPEPDQHREPMTQDSESTSWDMSGDEATPSRTQTQRMVRLYRRMYGSRIDEGEVQECKEIPEEYEGAALLSGSSQVAEPGSPRGGLRLSPMTWGSPEPDERTATRRGEEGEDGMDIDVSFGSGIAPDPISPYTLYTFRETHEHIRRSAIEFRNPPANPPHKIPVGFFQWSLSQFPGHDNRGVWHPANELSPLELEIVSRDSELHDEMQGAWDDRVKLMRGLAGGDREALELLWMAYKIRMGRLGFWEYEMSQSRRWFTQRKDELAGREDDVEMGDDE